MKLRCEVEGPERATEFRWYKNDAPVLIERGRMRIKTELRSTPQVFFARFLDTQER